MEDGLGGPTLGRRILDHLRSGPDNITGVTQALADHPLSPAHRLTVSGYLQALADAGILAVVRRGRSCTYRLAHPDLRLSLHQRLRRAAEAAGVPAARQPAVLVAALQHVLGRPVFCAELRHAGLEGPLAQAEGVTVVAAEAGQRRAYRALLQSRSHPPVTVPRGDPLLGVAQPAPWRPEADMLLARIVREATDSEHLAARRDTGRQAALRLDGAPA